MITFLPLIPHELKSLSASPLYPLILNPYPLIPTEIGALSLINPF